MRWLPVPLVLVPPPSLLSLLSLRPPPSALHHLPSALLLPPSALCPTPSLACYRQRALSVCPFPGFPPSTLLCCTATQGQAPVQAAYDDKGASNLIPPHTTCNCASLTLPWAVSVSTEMTYLCSVVINPSHGYNWCRIVCVVYLDNRQFSSDVLD